MHKGYMDSFRTPEFRFWTRIKIGTQDECWEWTGRLNSDGYGTFSSNVCHRIMWDRCNKIKANGHHVLHKCDNRKCVNPDHLFLGNHFDNMRDMTVKGRHRDAKGSKNGRSNISEDDVLNIRSLFKNGNSIKKIIKLYPISQTSAYRIIKNETWRHI